mmetsp:Transcript_43787/g.126478  ORF Transcript_43787/g.126478 Transcript_43787/m.126478 type:complete len:201 (-) Transcript_43787:346-948(-)
MLPQPPSQKARTSPRPAQVGRTITAPLTPRRVPVVLPGLAPSQPSEPRPTSGRPRRATRRLWTSPPTSPPTRSPSRSPSLPPCTSATPRARHTQRSRTAAAATTGNVPQASPLTPGDACLKHASTELWRSDLAVDSPPRRGTREIDDDMAGAIKDLTQQSAWDLKPIVNGGAVRRRNYSSMILEHFGLGESMLRQVAGPV